MCLLSTDKQFQYYCMLITGGDIVPSSVDAVSKSYIKMADEKLYKTIDFMQTVPSNVLYFCNAGATEEYIVDDYMKSKDNLKETLNAYSLQNLKFDISIITPNEKHIKDFLQWYDDQ